MTMPSIKNITRTLRLLGLMMCLGTPAFAARLDYLTSGGAAGGGGSGDVTQVGNCSTGACFGGASGTTLTSTTGEILDLATANTLIYQRNDAGTVTFAGKDNADPATTIYSTSGAGVVQVGTSTATSVDLISNTLNMGAGSTVTMTIDDGATDAVLTFNGGLGSIDIVSGGGDVTINDDLNVSDGSPVVEWIDTSGDDFRATVDASTWTLDNRTDSVNYLRINSTHLLTLGDATADVTVGSQTALGKFAIDGDSDEIQLLVQGHSTQTSSLAVLETSAGTDEFTFSNAGVFTANGSGTFGGSGQSTISSGLIINNAKNGASGDDLIMYGDTTDDLLHVDASANTVCVGTSTCTEVLSVTGNILNTGTVTSSATGSFGWSIVTGANTACTTTCTFAAVMGWDTAVTEVAVSSSDATADKCLCAGAN
jgi:hypothetical protein